MKNPFPGMNPWREEHWRDVHASLLVYARDQLNARLPPGLQARVGERLAIDAGEEKPSGYVPDVTITEPWDRPARPALGEGGAEAAVAEPAIVDLGEEVLRHVEIVDSRAHVITAIEVLSPSNKADVGALEPGRERARHPRAQPRRRHRPAGSSSGHGRALFLATSALPGAAHIPMIW